MGRNFGQAASDVPFADLVERLLFAETLEALRAYETGVIESVPDANVGSLLGIGFPAWTGGVIQYVNQYAGVADGFAGRAAELAARYGERFAPTEALRAIAAAGGVYG